MVTHRSMGQGSCLGPVHHAIVEHKPEGGWLGWDEGVGPDELPVSVPASVSDRKSPGAA